MSKKKVRLTPRELEILEILWSSDKPLIASDIANSDSGISINTVQAVLRKLLKENLIEVADIVYSGTVLTRSYRPVFNEEELQMENLKSQFNKIDKKSVSIPSILAFLIDDEEDDEEILGELEELIRKNKRELDMNGD